MSEVSEKRYILGEALVASASWSLDLERAQARQVRRGEWVGSFRAAAELLEDGPRRDLMSAGFHDLYVMSSRFVAAIEGLSGWVSYPATFGNPPERNLYDVLGITGRIGRVNFARSAVVKHLGQFVRLRGLVVERSEVNVPDFSLIDNYETILVSQRAADALMQARLTNVSLTPVEDYTFDVSADRIKPLN